MPRLLLLSFIWGWSFLFIKVAGEGMTPTTVAGLRVALGALTLFVLLRVRRTRLPTTRAVWGHLTVAAVFANVLPFTLLAWGEQRTTSSLTAVLNASTPMFTALAALAILGQRIRPKQVVGLLIGLAGVGLTAGLSLEDVTGTTLGGALAPVAAAACYGIGFAYTHRFLMDIPQLTAAAGQLIMASALLAAPAIASSTASGIGLTPSRIASVVLLGVFGTGIAYLLYYRSLTELGPTTTSLVTYVIPVVAVTVGILVLDEPFSLSLVIGGLVIALGISLVDERFRIRRPNSVAPVLLLLALLVGGCSASGGDSACGPVTHERLDPSSAIHLTPTAEEPDFLSDPPTSGPHIPGPPITAAQQDPLPRLQQTAVLEQGEVLIQYRDLSSAEQAELEEMATDDVVVAPNPDLPDRVVATAWTVKQNCTEPDLAALDEFVTEFVGAVDLH